MCRTIILGLLLAASALAETRITVDPTAQRQTFDGMGCGTIFYSGHITSLAKRNKHKLQEQFYDALFVDVKTQFLHLMIRPDFEPANDNEDPYRAEFAEDAFKANKSAVEVSKAALKRRPDMQLFATLYTPPSWMKTNGKPEGGGKENATLKPGLALELGEYIWAYLQHMQAEGVPVHYLSICNESDWEHSQPSYYLDANRHAALFRVLAEYLDTMAERYPDVPRPKLVAPNMLSAVDTAKRYWPALEKAGALDQVDVLGVHDYDRRGHRWKTLRELAGDRPLWCTEWCWNGKDSSPNLIRAASEFWLVMTEAFNDGANVWMAYDWAYPPREGGEALTHVEWGQSYHKTKIYHAFRQWCNPLTPGMRIVDCALTGPGATGISTPGVKSSAFLDTETGRLVVHIVNLQDSPADIATQISQGSYQVEQILRTSGEDAGKAYPARPLTDGALPDTLKPREMVTYVLHRN
ncbi:MAG: O-glycosyl hydrolase [Rhodothermales bacterium]|jgi:O-glycosyl hydrolase